MKVLVVDDSKAMRMIIVRTLKQAGISNLTTFELCKERGLLVRIGE